MTHTQLLDDPAAEPRDHVIHHSEGEEDIKTEEQLYHYWLSIGGTAGWRDAISGEDLQTYLAANANKIEKVNAAIRQGQWLRNVVIVGPGEMMGYVSILLPRLPKLRKLRIYVSDACWPFDWEEIAEVEEPFPALKHIGMVRTPWTAEQVAEMTERLPQLNERGKLISHPPGIGVYKISGPTKKEAELKEIHRENKKLDWLD